MLSGKLRKGSRMYWVFWDTILKRVRIHLADCGACRNGRGMHEGRIRAGRDVTYFWRQYPTYAAAREQVCELDREGLMKRGNRIDCGLCHPEISK